MSRFTKILRKKIPTERLLLIDFINFARKKNHIQIHCSFEITRLEEIFYNLKLKSKDVSKTAYFVYCLTQILKKYPSLRTYYYKKTSYCFDEIDILVPMEFKHQVLDKKVPVGIILRDLENKSYMNIMNEIREIQKMKLNEIEIVKKRRAFMKFPSIIRKWILNNIFKNPIKLVKYYGLSGISTGFTNHLNNTSSVHNSTYTIHTCGVIFLSTYSKLVQDKQNFVNKKFQTFTLMIDHNILDGIEMYKIYYDLIQELESCNGLKDIF